MYGLIHALYDERQCKAFESVYIDADAREQLLMRSVVAESLKDCPKLISSHAEDWILCTLSSFKQNSDDTMRVYQGIIRKFRKLERGNIQIDAKGKMTWREMNDLADTCLICLGFFKKRVEWYHKYHASPSVNHYRNVGSVAFKRLGFDRIGDEFDGWIGFIEKELTETSIL